MLTEVDVSDPAAMTILRTERIRGVHVSARLTGHTARVVVWSRPRAALEPAVSQPPARLASAKGDAQPGHEPSQRPQGGALPRRCCRPASFSGTRHAHRADDGPVHGLPESTRTPFHVGRRPRLRLRDGALRRHPALVRPGPRRPPTRPGGSVTLIHRFDIRRPEHHLPRARRGAGPPAQPVLDVRARRPPAGRQHGGAGVVGGLTCRREREPRHRARRAAGALRSGRVGGLGKGERSTPCASSATPATSSPSARPTRSTRSTSPTRGAGGGRRAEAPRLLRLPAPARRRPAARRRPGRHASGRSGHPGLAVRRVRPAVRAAARRRSRASSAGPSTTTTPSSGGARRSWR